VLWEALRSFRTGARRVDAFDDLEEMPTDAEGVRLLPNVELANGETDRDRRLRLMQTFNTPFLPDVLIASSVMAEGVDLHRECRHVIHHDLDWNPSTLEQRTGRVDRIGSRSESTGRPIVVCEPFVTGTQDEKQFRVVKERERWFGVLMGGSVPADEWATERLAERVPLPEELAKRLMLDLSVWQAPSG
jgi:superfamily II DNA/RNA helicase